jgi:hypothetical protein
MTIDTLEYAKRLEKAGVSREQAEAHAEALRAAVVSQVATKADVEAAALEIRGDLRGLRVEFQQAQHGLETKVSQQIRELEVKFEHRHHDLEVKFGQLQAKVQVLTWMVGFNLAATMAVL